MFKIKLSKSFCWGILVSSFTWLVTIYLYVHVASDNESTPSLPTQEPTHSTTETLSFLPQQQRLIPYNLQKQSNLVNGLKPNTSYARSSKQEFLKLSNGAGKQLLISILSNQNHFHLIQTEGEDGPVFVNFVLRVRFFTHNTSFTPPSKFLYQRQRLRWWTFFACRSECFS